MRTFIAAVTAAGLCGCPETGGGESPSDWYDRGSDFDVQEPVAFTDVPYDFTGAVAIADLPVPAPFTTMFATDDAPQSDGCDGWLGSEAGRSSSSVSS